MLSGSTPTPGTSLLGGKTFSSVSLDEDSVSRTSGLGVCVGFARPAWGRSAFLCSSPSLKVKAKVTWKFSELARCLLLPF